MRTTLILPAIALLCAASASAEAPDTRQAIFDPAFKTLQVRVAGHPDAPPVIMAGTNDRIEVSFDELADDRSYLRYDLTHCDALWRPEGLVDSEFLDGFNIGDVEDWAFSGVTLAPYVHYSVTIPNSRMQPLISGNYLLRVFPEDDPDRTLLQARFSVAEPLMTVSGRATSRTDIESNGRLQQVDLTVDVNDVRVDNIYGGDLRVVVSQNGRTDNEVVVSTPLRVEGSRAVFEHLRPLIFPAGNEYRRMEVSSTRFPGMGVRGISYAEPLYHFELWPDRPRAASRYIYDSTQFGRFRIREYDSTDSDLDADYVIVHFTLDMPRLEGYDIYLDGDFTNRTFSDEYRMRYNIAESRYETALLLKQGAYNYLYLAVPTDPSRPAFSLTAPVEGDFYNTVNEYLVKVYYRPPGTRYDRLMGVTTIYSGK